MLAVCKTSIRDKQHGNPQAGAQPATDPYNLEKRASDTQAAQDSQAIHNPATICSTLLYFIEIERKVEIIFPSFQKNLKS